MLNNGTLEITLIAPSRINTGLPTKDQSLMTSLYWFSALHIVFKGYTSRFDKYEIKLKVAGPGPRMQD